MPLIRGPGGGLIRAPGGGLATGLDCCCGGRPLCPPEGSVDEWSAVIEDLDTAWIGLVELGPHVGIVTVALNIWEGEVFYDSCDPAKHFRLTLFCADSDGAWSFQASNNPDANQPWAGTTGAGFTVSPHVSVTFIGGVWTVVFEFTKNVDGDPCGWGVGAAKNFRLTFTSL